MAFIKKVSSTFCRSGMMALGALILVALCPTARSQELQLVSSSAVVPLHADAELVSSSNALPSAPEPSGSPQYGGNHPTNSPYPHYGSGSRLDRWAFELGGGFNAPAGNDTSYITWGGNLTVGAGRNFTPNLAALLEYQFIDNKLTGRYDAAVGTPGGHIHIWSLTIDPVLSITPRGSAVGAYITGGGGFYRAVTSFTTPVEQCDIFFGCIVTNQTLAHYSSNQGGLNFGGGVTYKVFGPDSNARLFAEGRYVWIDGPKPTATSAGIGTIGLVPVTLGLRF